MDEPLRLVVTVHAVDHNRSMEDSDLHRLLLVALSQGGEPGKTGRAPGLRDVAGSLETVIEFTKTVGPIIGPVLAAALTAWLQGRAGRKLRLKVGELEVEAGSEEELRRLLDIAGAIDAKRLHQTGSDKGEAEGTPRK